MGMQTGFTLEGKTIVVTGAGSGIGRSIATACAAQGANVCVAGRRRESLEETVAQIDGSAFACQTDVSRMDDLQRMYDATLERFGRLDGVVANAGIIAPSGPVHEVDPEQWAAFIDTNLSGAFWTVALGARILVAQGEGGSILAIGSSTAIRAGPGMAPYVASKGGLHAVMKVAALDLGPHRIRVNTLVPGQTDTPPLRAIPGFIERAAAMLPLGEIADPDEIGRYAAFVLSDAVPHMTGALLTVDSGRTVS